MNDVAKLLGRDCRFNELNPILQLLKIDKVDVRRPQQRDIRRLIVTGAMAVIRWAMRRGAPANPWLARMLERKPPMVAAFALANKMARGVWAMMTRGESYRSPVIGSAA